MHSLNLSLAFFAVYIQAALLWSHKTFAFSVRHTAKQSRTKTTATVTFMSTIRSPDDLIGKLIHKKAFHRLRRDSDVANPRAMSMEERIVMKPNFQLQRLEPYGSRVLIFRNALNEEVLRFRVHESPDRMQLEPSTIATILYLACEDTELLFQERVLELNCQLGLAGLLGALCVGVLNNGKKANNEKMSKQNNVKDIDILPSKDKWASPLPDALQSITLSDDNPEALHLAAKNVQQVTTNSHLIAIQELDWRHHPRMHPGKNLYRGILGANLSYNFPNAKELARTVAYFLEPQIGRFVHIGPESLLLRKFLHDGYLMQVDERYITLESHFYQQQVLPEGDMPKHEFELQHVKEQTMEVVLATHHPEYDGLNGEFFFPMETGTFDRGNPDTYLEKGREGNSWKK